MDKIDDKVIKDVLRQMVGKIYTRKIFLQIPLREDNPNDELIDILWQALNKSNLKGVFTINVNTDLVGATLKMTDLSGRLIYSQNLTSLTNSFDLDQNAAGVYMIEISKDGKSSTQKIIIE